ncbi:stage II sporulation protein R [Vallitalea okinawensis]|uniref:stage II sporulation protein R n=1 Tax=Vallitalea okinawensis TaxID=2078660 RepID=UPI001FA8FE56|nr:stage II sporulation protein R [Vallitalea okinawensis]
MRNILVRVNDFWKKDRKMIYIAIVLGVIISFSITAYTKDYAMDTGEELAKNFIRFHVIANSDTEDDQLLKLAVRDTVLDTMTPLLKDSSSIDESRELIEENREEIEAIARDVIHEWNRTYDVKVSLGQANFPTKKYGDVVLPAGEYEALRIQIGEAKGKNWWCVMFPPLCFVDVTHGIVPDEAKEELETILTEDEYEMVLAMKDESELDVKVKFKIVEWWQSREQE